MAGRSGSQFGEISGIRAPTRITCVNQSAFAPQKDKPTEDAVFDSLSVPANAGTYAQGNARSSGLSCVPWRAACISRRRREAAIAPTMAQTDDSNVELGRYSMGLQALSHGVLFFPVEC